MTDRLEDVPGAPLVWQHAPRTLVAQLTGVVLVAGTDVMPAPGPREPPAPRVRT